MKDPPTEVRIVEENAKILRNLCIRDAKGNITDNGYYGAIQEVFNAKVTLRTYEKFGIKRLLQKFSHYHDTAIREAAKELINKIMDMEKWKERYKYDFKAANYKPSRVVPGPSQQIRDFQNEEYDPEAQNTREKCGNFIDNNDKPFIIGVPKEFLAEHSEMLRRLRANPALAKVLKQQINDKGSVISDSVPTIVVVPPEKDHNDNEPCDKSLLIPNPELLSPGSQPKFPKPMSSLSPESEPSSQESSNSIQEPTNSPKPEVLSPKEGPPRKRSPFNFSNGRTRPHPSAPATVTPVKPESPKRIRPYYPPNAEQCSAPPKKPAYQKTADGIVTDKIFIREDGVVVNSTVADKDCDKEPSEVKKKEKSAAISDKKKSDLKRILDLSDNDSLINEPISDRKKKKKLTKKEPVKIAYQPTQSPLEHYQFDVLKLHDILPYDYETVRPYLITLGTQDLKNFMDRNPKIADLVDSLFKTRCQAECPQMMSHFCLLKSWRELHDYYLINYTFNF